MKKILSLIAASALVLSLGLGAFAAGSKAPTTDLSGNTGGFEGVSEIKPVHENDQDLTSEAIQAFAADCVVTPLGMVDLMGDNGATVTITVDTVFGAGVLKDGDKVMVMHRGNMWEKVGEYTVSGGKFAFTADSFSPFAFAKVAPVAAPSTPAAPASPKTGETNELAFVVLGLVAVSAFGYAVSRKTSKN